MEGAIRNSTSYLRALDDWFIYTLEFRVNVDTNKWLFLFKR